MVYEQNIIFPIIVCNAHTQHMNTFCTWIVYASQIFEILISHTKTQACTVVIYPSSSYTHSTHVNNIDMTYVCLCAFITMRLFYFLSFSFGNHIDFAMVSFSLLFSMFVHVLCFPCFVRILSLSLSLSLRLFYSIFQDTFLFCWSTSCNCAN